VVGFVRGRSRVKRVGHAGTLDPMATGVLPLCLGQATRVVEYLVDATKTYVADVTLGVTTNTYDAEGEVIATADASSVTQAQIEASLPAFRGVFEQVPPAFSALKRNGVPLYKLARAGEEVTVEPRETRVDRLEVLSYEPPLLRLEIECAKGFYVRSLAHDLGRALGVGAMLSGLVRTRVGSFTLGQATDIEALKSALAEGTWRDLLLAPDEVLLDWHAAVLGETNEQRLRHGQAALFDCAVAGVERSRAYTSGGIFLAVLQRVDEQRWQPEKVFDLEPMSD
jgi:tRNA pseudouridine55 synthase